MKITPVEPNFLAAHSKVAHSHYTEFLSPPNLPKEQCDPLPLPRPPVTASPSLGWATP